MVILLAAPCYFKRYRMEMEMDIATIRQLCTDIVNCANASPPLAEDFREGNISKDDFIESVEGTLKVIRESAQVILDKTAA